MSKQKRIKKIVKSHLNRIQDDGEALYNDGITTTVIDRDAQLAAEESLGKLSAANLATALGITNPGKVNEVLNIDKDAQPDNLDAFPRDQREVADADDDGIGDNQEIVNLHVELLAIETHAALDAARVVEATTALTATATQLGELQDHELGGNNENFAAYQAALTAFNTAVSDLETLQQNAEDKRQEAITAQAAMAALPQPAAGIKYTVNAVVHTAKTVYDASAAKLAAIEALADAIDAECAIAGDPPRVADQNRTDAANTTSPAAP